MKNKFLTVKEFRTIYGIGHNYAYKIVNQPDFPAIKLGNKKMINPLKVDKWFDDNAGRSF